MKQIEQNTILNSTPVYLDKTLGPSAAQTQLTGLVMNTIVAGQKAPAQITPKQYCQFPNPPRLDDFNLKDGLGSISLQPAIDALNHFKQMCIQSIKTKLQSMGPDGSKDTKLAAGILSVIQDVYQAATCFTQIVSNINSLVSTYIQVIDIAIVSIVNKITQLENQIKTLQRELDPKYMEAELVAAVGADLLNALYISEVLNMLGAVDQLLNKIGQLQSQITNLAKSPQRLLMHLEADLTVLKGSLQSLNHLNLFNSTLQYNKTMANSYIMSDNFLDDFDYSENTTSGDYNWSVTNSAGLIQYNSDDNLNILNKLTLACHNYVGQSSSPIIIDSRSVSGTIIVNGDGDGVISGGIYPAPSNVGFIYELTINGGQTIIQGLLYGETPISPNTILQPTIGIFYSNQLSTFTYQKVTKIDSVTFNLYLLDINDANNINEGDWYYNTTANDPTTWFTTGNGFDTSTPTPGNPGEGWYFEIDGSDDSIYYYPMVFQVISVTNSYITVKILSLSTDLQPSQFNNILGITYVFNGGNPQTMPPLNTSDNPTSPVANNNTTNPLSIFSMSKYPINSTNLIPHVGQSIPCSNWTLSIQPFYNGNNTKDITSMSFVRINPSDTVSSIFLKCSFGFIPTTV